MKTLPKFVLIIATLASVGTGATSASANESWNRHHPRQYEVLAREHHQLARINHERREGDLSGAQARALRAGDRSIARQDHADARANGVYITRAQHRQLNAQENAQSRAVGH